MQPSDSSLSAGSKQLYVSVKLQGFPFSHLQWTVAKVNSS